MTDTTIASLLAELNELREEKGMKPLKAWKESRAKLEAKIDELDQELGNVDPEDTKGKEPPKPKKKPSKKPAAKAKKTPKKKKAPKSAPATDGKISVSDVARDLEIDPKVARAKLRRHGMGSVDGRWKRFSRDSKDHKEMIELLKSGIKRRAKRDADEE